MNVTVAIFLCLQCMLCAYSKIKELEEELHVVTNNLRSLEINEDKVRHLLTPHVQNVVCLDKSVPSIFLLLTQLLFAFYRAGGDNMNY